MDDCAIVALYWARDEAAIAASDEKYGGLCRQLSRQILASPEDAEECVNDTWGRAWNTMPPQRPASLRAYLLRIVRNVSIDRWRARRSQKRGDGAEALSLELESCIPPAPSAEAAWEQRELAAALDRWLAGRTDGERALFLRRYWFGEPVAQLARAWGLRPNAVSQRLRRLRESLRTFLESEGVVL